MIAPGWTEEAGRGRRTEVFHRPLDEETFQHYSAVHLVSATIFPSSGSIPSAPKKDAEPPRGVRRLRTVGVQWVFSLFTRPNVAV